MAEWTLLSTPVHSSASLRGIPAVSLIFSATSLGLHPLSMATVLTPGTNFFAKSSRLWNKSVITIGSAPAARAERRDMRPIGPAPLKHMHVRVILQHMRRQWRADQIRTGSPRRSSALSIPASATANGSQSEPSSKLTESGNLWSQAAGWRCHRVNVPNSRSCNR